MKLSRQQQIQEIFLCLGEQHTSGRYDKLTGNCKIRTDMFIFWVAKILVICNMDLGEVGNYFRNKDIINKLKEEENDK